MRYYDKITPDGTRDLLFGECDQRSQVTKTLKDLFVAQGYRRVMTPALEFYLYSSRGKADCYETEGTAKASQAVL